MTDTPTGQAFGDLADLFDPRFYFTVRGKQYAVEPPDGETGLRLQAVLALSQSARDGRKLNAREKAAILSNRGDAVDVIRDSLGGVHDELLEDGANHAEVRHCGITAFLYWTQGEAAALAYWASKPGRAEGNPPAPRTRTTSTSTAAASTTRRRASTSGTRSPSTSKRAAKPRRKG